MPRSEKPAGRRVGHRTAAAKSRAIPVRWNPPIQIVDTAGVVGARDEAAIRREIRKLSSFSNRILGVQVTVTAPHRRLHREVIRYQVRIRIEAPLKDLVVKRQEHTELLTAVQEAFKAARRLVQDHVRRHRAPVSPTASASRGKVARLFPYEGYGFIEGSNGDEVYFHRNSVLGGAFEKLAAGSPVRYAAEDGEKGLQASTVTIGRA
jgi:cold shock CspA family protein